MKTDVREHVCALLREALRLLDGENEAVAGIHVSQALETLRYRISDPVQGDGAAGRRSHEASGGS